MMKHLFAILAFLPAAAWAQSQGTIVSPLTTPGASPVSVAQINQAMMAKADVSHGILTAPTITAPVISGGGSISGVDVTNATVGGIGLSQAILGSASAPATSTSAGTVPSIGSPGGVPQLDSTGSLFAVNLGTQGAQPALQWGPPASPGGLEGGAAMALDSYPSQQFDPAPTTTTAAAAAGAETISVSSTVGVQPGQFIYVLNPTANTCYGGNSSPTSYGMVGAVNHTTNVVTISTVYQNPLGTYGTGFGQGEISAAIQSGAQVTFHYAYNGSQMQVTGCQENTSTVGNTGATATIVAEGGTNSASGVHTPAFDVRGNPTSPVALVPNVIMGPDYASSTLNPNKAGSVGFAMNPNCYLAPGSRASNGSGGSFGASCNTEELDVVNNSGFDDGGSYDLVLGIDGKNNAGAAELIEDGLAGQASGYYKGILTNLSAGDQADINFADYKGPGTSGPNVGIWDTAVRPGAALDLMGGDAKAAIEIRTNEPGLIPQQAYNYSTTAAMPTGYGTSGNPLTVNVGSNPAPLVGASVGNQAACNGNPFSCGTTVPSGDTISSVTVTSGVASIVLTSPTTGSFGSGSNIYIENPSTNGNPQIVWGSGSGGIADYYDPGLGSTGTIAYELGPVADGTGATFDLGPPAHITTISQSGGSFSFGGTVIANNGGISTSYGYVATGCAPPPTGVGNAGVTMGCLGAHELDLVGNSANGLVNMIENGQSTPFASLGPAGTSLSGPLVVAGQGSSAGESRNVVSTTANLPTCNAANEGARSGVTDATATTFLSTVAGGGTNHVPVYCNGTNWVIE